MTQAMRSWFRRGLVGATALGALGVVPVALAGTASAATTTTAYGHQQRCDETLTYEQETYYGPQFVIHRDVCDVQVYDLGGYRRHHAEDVTWQTDRYGYPQEHFAADVRDVEVYRY